MLKPQPGPKRSIGFLTAFFCLCFIPCLLAFQFEDYEWGKSIEETRVWVMAKHKRLLAGQKETVLSYRDTILNAPCQVYLMFTPKSLVLFMVKVVWEGQAVGEKVKSWVIKQYGEPAQGSEIRDRYIWFGSSSEEMAVLDFSSSKDTELYYTMGENEQ